MAGWYTDIGHGYVKAVLWLWDRGNLETYDKGEESRICHDDIWSSDDSKLWSGIEKKWRGRFDPKQNVISVLKPDGWPYSMPEQLEEQLRSKFGTTDIRQFGESKENLMKTAGIPIKDRGIRWEESYGDKSAYLKKSFEEQVGPGSYF